MRRLSMVALLVALAGTALTGCATLAEEFRSKREASVDFGEMPSAVVAAVPRVTGVSDMERSLNGFFYRLSLDIETDSSESFTAAELDAVIEAIWFANPWEPATIVLYATLEGTGEPVDIRAAAAELAPLTVRNAGRSGVTLTGIDARYGEWSAP